MVAFIEKLRRKNKLKFYVDLRTLSIDVFATICRFSRVQKDTEADNLAW